MELNILKIFIEEVMAPSAVVDKNGALLVANDSFLKYMRLDKGDAEGRHIFENQPDMDKNNLKKALAEIGGGKKEFHVVTLNMGGEVYELLFFAAHNTNNLKSFLALLINVTGRFLEYERMDKEIKDMSVFRQIALGREKKIVELKDKLALLEKELKRRA